MARNEISGYRIALVEERPNRAKGKSAVDWKLLKSISFTPDWSLDDLTYYMEQLSDTIDSSEWPYEYELSRALALNLSHTGKIPETIRVPSQTREFIERRRKEAEHERKEEEAKMRAWARRKVERRKR